MAAAPGATLATTKAESGQRRQSDERIRRRRAPSSPSSFSTSHTKSTISCSIIVAALLLVLPTPAAAAATSSYIGTMRSVTVATVAALGGRRRRQRQHSVDALAFVGGSLRWRTTATTRAQARLSSRTAISAKELHQGMTLTQPCHGMTMMMTAKEENSNGEENLSGRRNFSSMASNRNVTVARPPKRANNIIPPSYDAFLEEEGFAGYYDYVPDIYDMQDNYTSSSSSSSSSSRLMVNHDDDDDMMSWQEKQLQQQQPSSPEEFLVAARPPKTRPAAAAAGSAAASAVRKRDNNKNVGKPPSWQSLYPPSPAPALRVDAAGAAVQEHRLPTIFDMMSIPVSTNDKETTASGTRSSIDDDFDNVMSTSAWKDATPEIEEITTPHEELEEEEYNGPENSSSSKWPLSSGITSQTTSSQKPAATTTRSSPPPKVSPNWNDNDLDRSNFLRKASTGMGVSTDLDVVQERLKTITSQIYQENNGQEFNIQSPRQVAQVLFGSAGGSTNKEVLEGMAASGGNRMADLILQYRATSAELHRLQRRVATQEKRVRSASAVIRPATTATTTNTNTARTNSNRANSSTSTSHMNSTAAPAAAVVMEELDTDPLILVDASAYIFRAYYSMPPIHRSDGMPTGAVLGFCNMLNRLVVNRALKGERARLVLVFDPAKGTTFRHELYSEYKGHRPSVPVDLIPQFPLIRHAAVAYGICQLEAPSFEADDVIATLATMAIQEGIDANILSSDKDLMQLVTDKDVIPSIHMIEPMTMARVTYDDVVDKWGVPPQRLGDLLALAGDVSDNVPGVPGIGPKIAAMLLDEFSTLDNLLDNVENVKQKSRREKLQQHADMARLSRKLVDLERSVPLEAMTFPDGVATVADLRMGEFNPDRILAFYDQMGFKDLKRRFQNQLQRGQRPSSSSFSSAPAFIPRSKSSYGKKEKTEIPKPEDYADVPF